MDKFQQSKMKAIVKKIDSSCNSSNWSDTASLRHIKCTLLLILWWYLLFQGSYTNPVPATPQSSTMTVQVAASVTLTPHHRPISSSSLQVAGIERSRLSGGVYDGTTGLTVRSIYGVVDFCIKDLDTDKKRICSFWSSLLSIMLNPSNYTYPILLRGNFKLWLLFWYMESRWYFVINILQNAQFTVIQWNLSYLGSPVLYLQMSITKKFLLICCLKYIYIYIYKLCHCYQLVLCS